MYVDPAFRVDDDAVAEAIAEGHPFATLIANGPDGPLVAYAPLVAERDAGGRLQAFAGHLARANPLWRLASDCAVPAVAVFNGPAAYVSPSLYPSKKETGRVVPTWNYVAAEARGTLTVETDPDAIVDAYLRPVTDQMERSREAPWSVDDAPEGFTEKLAMAVVGVRLVVATFEAKRKIGQNRPLKDFAAVRDSFAASNDPAERALGAEMNKEGRT